MRTEPLLANKCFNNVQFQYIFFCRKRVNIKLAYFSVEFGAMLIILKGKKRQQNATWTGAAFQTRVSTFVFGASSPWINPEGLFPPRTGADGSGTHTSAYWRRRSPGVPGSRRRTCPSELRYRSREDSPCWCQTCLWLQKRHRPGTFSPRGPRCIRTCPCWHDKNNRVVGDKRSTPSVGKGGLNVSLLEKNKPPDFNFRRSIEDKSFPSVSPEADAICHDAKGIDYLPHIHVCDNENTHCQATARQTLASGENTSK